MLLQALHTIHMESQVPWGFRALKGSERPAQLDVLGERRRGSGSHAERDFRRAAAFIWQTLANQTFENKWRHSLWGQCYHIINRNIWQAQSDKQQWLQTPISPSLAPLTVPDKEKNRKSVHRVVQLTSIANYVCFMSVFLGGVRGVKTPMCKPCSVPAAATPEQAEVLSRSWLSKWAVHPGEPWHAVTQHIDRHLVVKVKLQRPSKIYILDMLSPA